MSYEIGAFWFSSVRRIWPRGHKRALSKDSYSREKTCRMSGLESLDQRSGFDGFA